MGIAYYCQGAHFLRHRSEHTCAYAIFHQVDSVTKLMHCKTKQAITLKSEPKSWGIGMGNKQFPLEYSSTQSLTGRVLKMFFLIWTILFCLNDVIM